MAKKKTPAWQQMGFKEVKSPSGNRKGFTDKEGNYISERQFRKMVGTPIKGSEGYKERQEAKKAGKNFRPQTEEQIYKEMQKAAKKPGMTLQEFMTGKSRELAYSERRTQAAHNKFIDQQRKEAIEFKRLTGELTDKKAAAAQKQLEEQIKVRKQLEKMNERRNTKLTREQREKLEKDYRKKAAKYKELQAKLEKKGLVVMDDKPSNESLRYGYYH